jgi:NADPH-dependent F420 reductase
MGRAITRRLIEGGNTVLLASRALDKAKRVADEVRRLGRGMIDVLPARQVAARAQIVVLATPYRESAGLAVELSDLLAGKIVIDISNPLNASYDNLFTDPETSAAEEIQRRLPDSSVVKAFNTNFAGPLFNGEVNGHQLDVIIASNDVAAKGQVDALVRSCGLRPLDAGALANSRTLERIQLLCIELQFKDGLQFQSALEFQPRNFDPPALQASP